MTRVHTIDSQLRRRILGEYEELPGLRLSIRQAARLWNLDLEHCQTALDLLVAEGRLMRSTRNEYCANTFGREQPFRDQWYTRGSAA